MTGSRFVETHRLRAAFARSLSSMYGNEVPAYTTLVEVSTQVNSDALAADPARAQRLGRIDRVTAERHGAIRVGTARELARVATIFAALGMSPVGFYDLRGSQSTSLPIVSTAFRPTSREALAINPFRVFTSVLVTDDRRYFDADLQSELDAFLARRELFPDVVIALAERAEREGGLDEGDAEEFLRRATACFELSTEPVDRAWYERLARISGVAADIGGVTSTHINHLTPRVLDIDDLYRRMTERGITMIDEIQGPPRWHGPDVLLRQTSFKALAEPRRFREADGSVVEGHLSVRFGEVEQRGIALTRVGRDLYDRLVVEVDERVARGAERDEAKLAAWQSLPTTEADLDRLGLGFFEYRLSADRPAGEPPADLDSLLDEGWLEATPIVYEDFLPRSAAGIFASNLDDAGTSDTAAQGSLRDEGWMAEALGRDLGDPFVLYEQQRAASLGTCARDLGRDRVRIDRPRTQQPRTDTRGA
ncbi:2-oxoadipate dioxygenase/decarboxylase [Aestuariimicrobium kwangyangense]|uniref:2-oxoadipate dioxygenase/decarboxylase n=1 Tax=Aestuariimicrobium kwangyangense TaxID=396389 RepID=UPI0003B5236C|nr:VOC family protein [Aestuariimicrobium kwangyangense]